MKKRWLPVLLAVLLSVTIIGCEKNTADTENTGASYERETTSAHVSSGEKTEEEKTSGTQEKTTAESTEPSEEISSEQAAEESQTLLIRDDWSPRVKENLNTFLSIYGRGGSGYTDHNYVVFDFDNTTVIFDIETQLMAYQIRTMAYAMTPDQMENLLTSADLAGSGWKNDILSAYRKLYESYGPFTGQPLSDTAQEEIQQDPYWREFAAKMLAVSGTFSDEEFSLMWPLYLFEGMTEQQVYDLAFTACKTYENASPEVWNMTSPAEIASSLGIVTGSAKVGCRVTENIRELWQALSEDGISVYVCSASGSIPVRAAIDAYGLHACCSGVGAINVKTDNGKIICELNSQSGWFYTEGDNWISGQDTYSVVTTGVHKSEIIESGLVTRYGTGPLAGFMDSTGDYNFCTEFSSMKLALCMNRASAALTNGGGVIAALAVYLERQGADLQSVSTENDILYLLQGRDENTMTLRPAAETVRLGETDSRLFADPEISESAIAWAQGNSITVKQFIETFAERKEAGAEGNPLPYTVGFLKEYSGYRSR